jgi:hypothetical protein
MFIYSVIKTLLQFKVTNTNVVVNLMNSVTKKYPAGIALSI